MAQRPSSNIQNNFTGGLKTEATGLNFPENAATDTDNCIYSLVGDVYRREGFDYEDNFNLTTIDRTEKAISTYKWNNAGGDGETQVVVEQVGSTLYFYESSAATVTNPLSTQQLTSIVPLTNFLVAGSSEDPSGLECQYSDGNGYLFVYHPYLEPFYCIFADGIVSGNIINIQVRDFNGIPEPSVSTQLRPLVLTAEHTYNLQNQGWANPPNWIQTVANTILFQDFPEAPGVYSGVNVGTGNHTFTVATGISASPGDPLNLTATFAYVGSNTGDATGTLTATGRVISYSGTTMVIFFDTVTPFNIYPYVVESLTSPESWTIVSNPNQDLINTWHSDIGDYPSNADVWWQYKDDTDTFNPPATINSVTFSSAPAPQGHFILNAFNQQQSTVSGLTSLTNITTTTRPRTGTWFAGRVWYAGVDASQQPLGDQGYYTWTENIYFSQIVDTPVEFGLCYQTDDPTDENLFLLLPSDGGVITIQGSGAIYKLFPIQNGMLVFAANGIWFITGSQGIGFSANDYTITKISAVQSLSSTSYVDVQGLPMFWNEEGIYAVEPAQQGLGLTVNPITVGTILSFYNQIPLSSKKYARGSYNPLTYILQWVYNSTQESDVTSRYEFDSILNLNIYTKSFYPYSIANATGSPYIHGVTYVSSPGGSNAPKPTFKYVTSVPNGATYQFTFSEELDDSYFDWVSHDNVGIDFNSYFITGYRLAGQGQRQFQPQYVYMYSRNDVPNQYRIQGLWNYANTGNSGKWSSQQLIVNDNTNFNYLFRRHRIRGHGQALQLKVSSVSGQPFDIIGWSVLEVQNASS